MLTKLPYIKYFKNLDGLRFFAALAVIIGHSQHVIEMKQHYKPYEPFANKLASFGVDFFYVLSGFLISYLLMQEISKTGTLNIRHFYYRRFLKIWPLYFLFGILGLSTGHHWVNYFNYLSLNDGRYIDYVYNWADYLKNLLFLSTFSTNIQTLMGYQDPVSSFTIGHFWSLAVEEQFYLIWAPMFYIFRKRVWIVILTFTLLGFLFNQIPNDWVKQYTMFHYNFTVNRFLLFGLGACFAWLIQYISLERIGNWIIKHISKLNLPPSVSKQFSKRFLGLGIVILLQTYFLYHAFSYLFGNKFPSETQMRFYNGLVSVLILAVAISKDTIISFLFLENKLFKYLGKISYGIYIFHILSVYISYKLLENSLHTNSQKFYILFPFVATIIASLLATLSYEFFEKKFLTLKDKFKV